MIYGIVSDIHAHNWSTFSKGTVLGVNQRLQIIIDEFVRAAKEVVARKGSVLVIAGDIFHVRGSIDPEVLNPFQAAVRQVLDQGVFIYAIPGNHDLKTKETNALASAVSPLGETFSGDGSFHVFNEPRRLTIQGQDMAFVPWRSTTAQLLDDLEGIALMADADGVPRDDIDVFIHAGIDGVLNGMPDHGLTAKMLGAFGFRHIFAGHYHNHKDLGDGVFSIGATTHQTWSDVDTKAGFVLVEDGNVTHMDTHAPKFVDLSGRPEEEMELLADGNYVRFRGGALSPDQVTELREQLEAWGARGVTIAVTKAPVVARAGSSSAAKAVTLDESVQNFVAGMKDVPAHVDLAKVKTGAADILSKSRAVYEET